MAAIGTGRRRYCLATLLAAAGLAGLPAATHAAVTVSNSAWAWGNPLPQGNKIDALDFVGGRGYAVGQSGTVLRTDDAGATWMGLRTGIFDEFTMLQAVDADTVIVGGYCSLRRSDDGGRHFVSIAHTPARSSCSNHNNAFYFPSSRVGYRVDDRGNVFHTANGGQTWSRRTSVPTTSTTDWYTDANDVFFTATDSGLAVTSRGEIYRTTDSARSWTLVASVGAPLTAASLNAIDFPTLKTGYAIGDRSTFLKTTDAGKNWTVGTVLESQRLKLTRIRCASSAHCVALEGSGRKLLHTADGGATWTEVASTSKPVYAVAFASETRAFAAGWEGTTVMSDDGGATWSTVGGELAGPLIRIRASSPSFAHAFGSKGSLARTTDGGSTWTNVWVPTGADIRDVAFPTLLAGYAIDAGGSAFKTLDGGASWRALSTGQTNPQAILALDQSRVFVIGSRGIRISTDAGEHFADAHGRAVQDATLSSANRVGANGLFAYGEDTIVFSSDSGSTWKRLRPPDGVLQSVDFVNPEHVFVLMRDARLWHSKDGGKTWLRIESTGSSTATDVSFGSARHGFMTTQSPGGWGGGYALRTSDGGRTWRPQLLTEQGVSIVDVVATNAMRGLALAGHGFLLSTSTGGDSGAPSRITLKPIRQRLTRRAKVRLNGKLTPANGGEKVLLMSHTKGANTWYADKARVAVNGTFSSTRNIATTTTFVAQWAGDADNMGDGSPAVTVKVGRRH